MVHRRRRRAAGAGSGSLATLRAAPDAARDGCGSARSSRRPPARARRRCCAPSARRPAPPACARSARSAPTSSATSPSASSASCCRTRADPAADGHAACNALRERFAVPRGRAAAGDRRRRRLLGRRGQPQDARDARPADRVAADRADRRPASRTRTSRWSTRSSPPRPPPCCTRRRSAADAVSAPGRGGVGRRAGPRPPTPRAGTTGWKPAARARAAPADALAAGGFTGRRVRGGGGPPRRAGHDRPPRPQPPEPPVAGGAPRWPVRSPRPPRTDSGVTYALAACPSLLAAAAHAALAGEGLLEPGRSAR